MISGVKPCVLVPVLCAWRASVARSVYYTYKDANYVQCSLDLFGGMGGTN